MTFSIEIDCAPGYPRPDAYIFEAVKDTILQGKVTETVSRCFGNWKWQFEETPNSEERETIYQRLKSLYEDGKIRYANLNEE